MFLLKADLVSYIKWISYTKFLQLYGALLKCFKIKSNIQKINEIYFTSCNKYKSWSLSIRNRNNQHTLQPFLHRFYLFIFKWKLFNPKWIIIFWIESMLDTKKFSGKKILRFKKIYKFATDYFFIRVMFFNLFIWNLFMKIRNSIPPPKYTRYRKNVMKKICLFQNDLQLWPQPFFL